MGRDPLYYPYLEPNALLSSVPRARRCMALAEEELTFTPSSGLEFTGDISGKLDLELNQFVRGAFSRSLSDIALFLLD